MSKYLCLGAFALLIGFAVTPASAAPGGLTGIQAGRSQSAAEQVNYRRCWWHNGRRHCRWVGDGYGYGPGVNLYFGGGGHRGHHGHHRR